MSIVGLKEREHAVKRLIYLKDKHPEALEILSFLERVLNWQLNIYEKMESRGEKDRRNNISDLYSLLDLCINYGSETLKEMGQSLMEKSRGELIWKIEEFLEKKTATDEERFIFLAFLNPLFSAMAENMDIDTKGWLKETCPVCGFPPSVSYIMDTEDVEGGRFLSCVLCHTSWLYYRTKCVRCGNVEDDAFEYFYDQQSRYIQIQVCKRCNTYMKVVDLRMDGLAVPHIDDIATLSLDLWARDQGFERYEKNMFGV